MSADLRERSVRVQGVGSPVIEAGPAGAREAAVFVHGNPGSSRDWERLVSAVGEHGRAVALDMPGFGRADKPSDFDYTVSGYATWPGRCASLEWSGRTSWDTTSVDHSRSRGRPRTPTRS